MFAAIDSLFPSRFIHLGADETFELGRGQTADASSTAGIGTVYLDFLKQIEDALRPTRKEVPLLGRRRDELVRISSSTLPRDLDCRAVDVRRGHVVSCDSSRHFAMPGWKRGSRPA